VTDRRTDRQTDGQTDGIAIAYTRYSIYAVARKKDARARVLGQRVSIKQGPPTHRLQPDYTSKHAHFINVCNVNTDSELNSGLEIVYSRPAPATVNLQYHRMWKLESGIVARELRVLYVYPLNASL